MYLLLVFLSITGSCLSGLFGRYLGSFGASIITTSCLFFSFLIALFAFYEVSLVGCFVYIKLSIWINSEVLNIDWGFMFDILTVIMCVVVTFFMLILVTADNFIQMFVGWQGVGLCSYLLINFWFTRIQANKAAIKAMILNRIGDFSLVMGILIIFINYKSEDYASVAALTPFFKNQNVNFLNMDLNILNIVGLLLLIGAVGKSAQLGLHTWLPDAMEGPTPVPALIHAATKVTAGVFLLARISFLYEHTTGAFSFFIDASVSSFFLYGFYLVKNSLFARVLSQRDKTRVLETRCGTLFLQGSDMRFVNVINGEIIRRIVYLSPLLFFVEDKIYRYII